MKLVIFELKLFVQMFENSQGSYMNRQQQLELGKDETKGTQLL